MKKASIKFPVTLLFACIAGIVTGIIDTSKNWDDTAITAGLILITAFLSGLNMPKFAWLWALIIGGIVFIFNSIVNGNYGSAIAIIFAFTGAYAAVLINYLIHSAAIK